MQVGCQLMACLLNQCLLATHQLLLLLPVAHQARTCQRWLHAATQPQSPKQQPLLQRQLQPLLQVILLLLCVLAAAVNGCAPLKTSETRWLPLHY
jgi:hypothetical protein